MMQTMRKSKLWSGLAMCLTAILILGAIPGIGAKAASYSGSGTKADPYLVQTAEQLQGMRDNLSAHYKLANTIDLSGVDFKPIGRLDGPFTGSFTCELNSDKTPKYVIKNLKIHVTGTYNRDTYVEKKGKMEAGLFGATSGATISGIYVLDANVSNDFFGDNGGGYINGVYGFNRGMDDMATGIIVAIAQSTTLANCGATGVVDTRSNHCGGFVGRAVGCTIKNCYSTANVTSEGRWCIGGLIGSVKGGTVSNCYSTGNVAGSQSNIGSFAGETSDGATFIDCYSAGNASGGKERKNSFVVMSDGESATFKNCFALGTIDAAVEIKDNPITTSNCWVLSGKLHNTAKFTEGSIAQISSAFKGQANWSADGSSQPQLTGIGVVSDASKYVPEAVSQQSGTTAGGSNGQTTTIVDGTTGGQAVTLTPEQVAALIEALPNPEEENAITLEHKEAVQEAYAAYESLGAGAKDEFNADLVAKLMAARYKMSILLATELVKSVKALPAVEELTPEYVDEIIALWKDYEFIEESVLKEIDDAVIKKLEAAYEYASDIKENGATYVNITDVFTGWQKIILIVSIALFLAAFIFNVVMLILFMKKMQSPEQKAVKAAKKEAKLVIKKAKKEK